MKIVFVAPLLWSALAAQTTPPSLEVTLEGLRNQNGVVHLCLTRDAAHFPNCADDPQALKETISASVGTLRITGFPEGTYAVSIFHDENRNGKLDTFVGIPREGFGFSRNPVVRFGPPQFDRVRVNFAGGITRLTVRMQYLL
jgi:uncharacterized protein (DUF2141 family)